MANEAVDPFSGSLTIVATDLVLPGNAGMDLRVTRVYSSNIYPDYQTGGLELEEDSWAGIGWKLHFGRVLHEESSAGGGTVIEMGDGSRHPLYHTTAFPEGWITRGFWRYDKAAHTLKLPNGVVYTFGQSVFLNDRLGTVRYVTEIRDPFNNTLTFTYFSAPGPPDGVAQIHQALSPTQSRDVTFTYDATLKGISTMTYGSRTWTYSHAPRGPSGYSILSTVQPPAGVAVDYEYSTGPPGNELTVIRVPSGGTVTYAYGDVTQQAGSVTVLTRAVSTRVLGGFYVMPGTWTFAYGTGSNKDTSIVSCPCGTTIYRYNGIGVTVDPSGWKAGVLLERRTEDNGVLLEKEELTWVQSEAVSADAIPGLSGAWADPGVFNALLASRKITRGTRSWTTTFEYHAGLGNWNDYGRSWRIESEGEHVYQNRRTTQTFQYGFTPYLVDRIASQSVRVQTAYDQASGPVDSTWTYALTTGFLTSQNVNGIPSSAEATPEGNVAASLDARGNRTTYGYAWGRVANVQTPSTQVSFSINPDGTVAWADNHVDVNTVYSYDTNGRATWVRHSGFNGIFYDYDNINARFLRVGGGQAQTQFDLDGLGRAFRTTDRNNLKTRVEWDACGRTTFSSAPYTAGTGTRGATTQYDALGRVTQVTDPSGGVTRFLYSGIDVTRIDAGNRSTTFGYIAFSGPGSERLNSVQDAAGAVTSYAYDVHGNLTKVTGPAAGLTRTWVRDERGLILSETQPESGSTTSLYDAAGNLTQVTDANNQTTTLVYDADNRLTFRNAPGTTDDLTVVYNAAGRPVSLTGGGTTTTLGYDAKGRTSSRTDVTGGLSFASSYGYDLDDAVTSVAYPSGRVVTYEYDLEHRLTNVRQNGGLFARTFTYDDAGRLASYVTGAVTHTVTYDQADRPGRILSSSVGGGLDLTYTYDPIGNVRTITDPRPGASQTFTLDPLDRLASADGPWGGVTWTYDAAGNRLSQGGSQAMSYTYNAATQRLTSSSGAIAESFTYDNAGQLTADGRGTYGYSPLGRLISATSTGVAANYTYDAAGGRLAKTVNGQTTYTVRSASGDPLSEYGAACGTPVWTRDTITALGRPIGAVRSTATTPIVSVTATTASAAEGGGSRTVSFTLATPGGAALGCAVTAAYHTTPGTASSGADYGEQSGTVTFAAGSPTGATQTVSITILQDSLDEVDEAFSVDLGSASGAGIGTNARTTITITDDDPTPTLSISDASVTEGHTGSTNATFTVSLSAVSGRAVQVGYATSNGTASTGSDYQPGAGTVTIPAGIWSVPIPVTVLGDVVSEASEQFSVTLSVPVNATIGDGTGGGTIVDDDPVAVTLSVDRSFPLQAGTSMTWTATASGATAPYEYKFYLFSNATGWRIVQAYGTANTFTWTPATADTYNLQVWVRSAGSVQFYDGWAGTSPVTITAAPAIMITSFTSNVALPVAAGTPVTWTAVATGGAPPLQFKFYAYDPTTGWSVLADYGSANTVTWTPLRPGTHVLQVWVRRPGSTAAYDTYAETGVSTVTEAAPVVTSLTASAPTPVAPGTAVTWTAQAGGPAAALEYQFYLYRVSTATWTIPQAYSAASTWTWTPSVADTYAVQVWVRVPGSGNSYDAWLGSNYVAVTSGPVSAVSLTVNQTLPVAPDSPLTWTANASGGTAPLQFTFIRYDFTAATWTIVQDWSASKTYTWTPPAASAGVGVLQVWVRSTGSGVGWEAYTSSGLFLIIP